MSNEQDDFVMTLDPMHQSRGRKAADIEPTVKKSLHQVPMTLPKVEIDSVLAQTLDSADAKIRAFQDKQREETIAATVFSTAVSAALRREYLDSESNIRVLPNHVSNFESAPIQWLRLSEVGIENSFTPAKAAEALESVFSAFHIPNRMRLLFLVSSDASETGDLVSVHVGLQPKGKFQFGVSIPNFISGFLKSSWPGLSLEPADDVDFDFAGKANVGHRGVRILTGIPSGRSKENVSATVDKLTGALSGHSWRYLVVAEPISGHEMEDTIRTCRELSGRAESMKSFQLSESIGKTVGDNLTHSEGETDSASSRKMSVAQQLALVGTIGTGVLSVACPALLPAFLTVATTSAAGTAVTAKAGLTMLLSLMGGSMLAGASTTTHGKTVSDTVSKSLSESENFSFSRTIVNKHAEGAVKLIESQIARFQLCEGIGAWETGVYFVGEDETTAEIGSNVLKSLISGDNSHQEPVRIFNPCGCSPEASPVIAFQNFDNPYILPMNSGEVITHPFGKRFENLRTVVNTRELTRLINFPLSNIPGISVRRIASDTGLRNQEVAGGSNRIVLGDQIYRGQVLGKYPYSFDKNLLAKHALVCGINGSGKTNTILGILGKLLEGNTPFLVIEPAKQEYVDWALKRNREIIEKYKGDTSKAKSDRAWINVYIPGREKWKGADLCELMLNPFDFVWLNGAEKPKVLEHIDRLKTIINAALPMQESLPILMEELIFSVYSVPGNDVNAQKCWLPGSQPPGFPRYDFPTFGESASFEIPTFVQMAGKVDAVVERFNYAKDAKMTISAALKARIASFKRGWRLKLLNKASPRKCANDWNELFNRPTIINLTSLTSDEDKAFFMAVIMMFVYEYRQELSEMEANAVVNVVPGINDNGLKSLLVIEEAHRVLGRSEGAVAAFAAAPRQKVSEMFSNMISEVRAYGQGILIADQIPSRLNEDAVKNTNLKIVHKLVAADDRRTMSIGLNLWNDQERIISDLKVGEALVRCDMDDEAYMVKIKKSVG